MENSKFTVEFNSDNGGLKVHRSQERCRPHELDRRAWNLELSPRDGVPRSEAERRQSRFSRYRCSVLKETLERRAWAAIFCWSGSISATGAVQFPQLEQFNFRNWSSLSAYAFSLHTQVTGDNALRMQVKKILRNLLCLFFPDGTASCAYLHPYSVTMLNPDDSEIAPARRGEFFDLWANDQDFALYYILRAEDKTDLSQKGNR